MPTITIDNQELIALSIAARKLNLTKQGLNYLIKTRSIKTFFLSTERRGSAKGMALEDFQQLQQRDKFRGRPKGSQDTYQRSRKNK